MLFAENKALPGLCFLTELKGNPVDPAFVVAFEETASLRASAARASIDGLGSRPAAGAARIQSYRRQPTRRLSSSTALRNSFRRPSRRWAGQPRAEVAAGIRAAFERGAFPPDCGERITIATGTVQAIQATRLARRGTVFCTAEDLAEASFAGQQDTYLNVRGEGELLGAVGRCFGSLWSERAIDYRSRQGLPPLAARLAVVVQQMVFADAAGVAFTQTL